MEMLPVRPERKAQLDNVPDNLAIEEVNWVPPVSSLPNP
jgi:hypothetical protein